MISADQPQTAPAPQAATPAVPKQPFSPKQLRSALRLAPIQAGRYEFIAATGLFFWLTHSFFMGIISGGATDFVYASLILITYLLLLVTGLVSLKFRQNLWIMLPNLLGRVIMVGLVVFIFVFMAVDGELILADLLYFLPYLILLFALIVRILLYAIYRISTNSAAIRRADDLFNTLRFNGLAVRGITQDKKKWLFYLGKDYVISMRDSLLSPQFALVPRADLQMTETSTEAGSHSLTFNFIPNPVTFAFPNELYEELMEWKAGRKEEVFYAEDLSILGLTLASKMMQSLKASGKTLGRTMLFWGVANMAIAGSGGELDAFSVFLGGILILDGLHPLWKGATAFNLKLSGFLFYLIAFFNLLTLPSLLDGEVQVLLWVAIGIAQLTWGYRYLRQGERSAYFLKEKFPRAVDFIRQAQDNIRKRSPQCMVYTHENQTFIVFINKRFFVHTSANQQDYVFLKPETYRVTHWQPTETGYQASVNVNDKWQSDECHFTPESYQAYGPWMGER